MRLPRLFSVTLPRSPSCPRTHPRPTATSSSSASRRTRPAPRLIPEGAFPAIENAIASIGVTGATDELTRIPGPVGGCASAALVGLGGGASDANALRTCGRRRDAAAARGRHGRDRPPVRGRRAGHGAPRGRDDRRVRVRGIPVEARCGIGSADRDRPPGRRRAARLRRARRRGDRRRRSPRAGPRQYPAERTSSPRRSPTGPSRPSRPHPRPVRRSPRGSSARPSSPPADTAASSPSDRAPSIRRGS